VRHPAKHSITLLLALLVSSQTLGQGRADLSGFNTLDEVVQELAANGLTYSTDKNYMKQFQAAVRRLLADLKKLNTSAPDYKKQKQDILDKLLKNGSDILWREDSMADLQEKEKWRLKRTERHNKNMSNLNSYVVVAERNRWNRAEFERWFQEATRQWMIHNGLLRKNSP